MTVNYATQEYKVLIGRFECQRSRYIPHEEYTFLYSSKFNHLTTLNRRPEMRIPKIIGGFMIGIFFLVRMKQNSAKRR